MQKKSRLLLIIGLICLLVGGYLYFGNDGKSVNEQNIEIATNATNAQDAARQISENNRGEVGGHFVAMFLLGIGGMLTIVSVVGMMKKNPS